MTETAQNTDFRRKPQIFADSPFLLEIPAFGGRRKPQKTRRFSQETENFRRKPQETADWVPSICIAMPLPSSSLQDSKKSPVVALMVFVVSMKILELAAF